MAVIHPNLNQKVRGLRCWYCGNQAYNLDHRIPQSRMRGVGPGNKVPACLTCNSVKGSFTVDEFREYLKQHAKSYKSRCRPRLGMIIRTIEPHGFIFFGERHWAKGFDSALAGIEERHRGIAAFIGGRDLWRGWLRENKHLDSDTPQRAYWHAGYMAALADVLELLGEGTAPKRMNSICSASNKTTVENEDL